jgi:hypothetical protein
MTIPFEGTSFGKRSIMVMQISVFLRRCLLCFFPFSALISAIAVTGCTTVHKDFKPFTPTHENQIATQTKVAVILPNELCSLYYIPRDFQEFSLGPVVCDNARIAARRAFADPVFFKSERDAQPAQADYLGIVRSRDVWLHSIRKIPARVVTGALLSWEVHSRDGKRLYGATVYGEGEDQRTFGLSDVRYETSMQECMDDLAAKLCQQMSGMTQRAAKNVAATDRIREAIEGYQIGITTYAQYQDTKDADWHVFAVQERAKHDNVDYSYLLDPESNKHVSSIGSWETKWVRYLPVIDSLRPSVYLPESKIDHSKINTVYIRELIGSVYDDHPLCELVFAGSNYDRLLLTQRSCHWDYLSTGKYVSVDTYQNRPVDKVIQQWLKLRPGMSREEVGELIGPPQKATFNSATNTWVSEYGYGRIRFYREGLSNWRLY